MGVGRPAGVPAGQEFGHLGQFQEVQLEEVGQVEPLFGLAESEDALHPRMLPEQAVPEQGDRGGLAEVFVGFPLAQLLGEQARQVGVPGTCSELRRSSETCVCVAMTNRLEVKVLSWSP